MFRERKARNKEYLDAKNPSLDTKKEVLKELGPKVDVKATTVDLLESSSKSPLAGSSAMQTPNN